MAIDLVLDHWPFVLTKFDGEQTSAELEAYIKRMDAVHARKERYVGISFLKRYARDRPQVERIGRWVKDTEEVTRTYCLAAGMINDSTGFRFLLSAVFLIKRMPCPYQVCATFDDAVTFVRKEAGTRGLVLPPVRRPWADLP
jgi:hypothetical protein